MAVGDTRVDALDDHRVRSRAVLLTDRQRQTLRWRTRGGERVANGRRAREGVELGPLFRREPEGELTFDAPVVTARSLLNA